MIGLVKYENSALSTLFDRTDSLIRCSEPSDSCIEKRWPENFIELLLKSHRKHIRMKYQWGSWKGKPKRHQMLVDNANPTKTTRMNGYGMGVTFTTRCFMWDKNFTSTVEAMRFFEPLVS